MAQAATAAPTKDGERRSDVMIKRKMLVDFDKVKVLFAVEDRTRVVQMSHEEG